MELFEEIRREYRFGVGTIQGVAKKLNTHRRMVRQALASAIPPERKTPARSSPKLGPVREFIDGILQSDREAPRKQRHTAHRIWERIRQEHPEARVAEATVRRYVRRRKQELGLAARETFVPQSYDWGGEGPGGLVRGRGGVRGGPPDRALFQRCAAWRAAERFTPRIFTPRSKRFWKRTSGPFTISAGCSGGCVTTT